MRRIISPLKSRNTGSTTATLVPNPSSTQCRGPLSFTIAAPISWAMVAASRVSHSSCGQSLSICVPYTSACRPPSRRYIASTSP
jgi:hypothetical protein